MKRIMTSTLALLAALMLCFADTGARALDTKGVMLPAYAAQVVQIVNRDRAAYGLEPLRVDPELTYAAQVRAREIVEKTSHTRPNGSHWSTVSDAAFAENIARGQKNAEKVSAAWMSSAGHRRNILGARYASIGVACYYANGIYHWVQLFGQ